MDALTIEELCVPATLARDRRGWVGTRACGPGPLLCSLDERGSQRRRAASRAPSATITVELEDGRTIEVHLSVRGRVCTITDEIVRAVSRRSDSALYITYTSANLTVQENADPSVARDGGSAVCPEDDSLCTTEVPTTCGSHQGLAHGDVGVDSGRGCRLASAPAGSFWEHHHHRGIQRKVLVHVGE